MNVLINENFVTWIINGKQTTVFSDENHYKLVLEAIKNKDEQVLNDIADNRANLVKPLLQKVLGENVVVDDTGAVSVDGKSIPESLSERIINHDKLGLPVEPLINFVRKLRLNPSSRSQLELFDFLKDKGLPIDDDGDFYAYKAVASDYFSKRGGTITLTKGSVKDGKIYNAPGEEIACERSSVDDDRDNECSFGLHAGRLEYATQVYYKTGDKVVILKINPKDVVSVPRDYNATKLRTSAYKVVSDYTGPLPDYHLNQDEYIDEIDDYEDDYFDNYAVCGSSCPCNPIETCKPNLSKGDIVSFKCFGHEFYDVIIGKVQGDRFYGINDDGFGSWDINEVDEWIGV